MELKVISSGFFSDVHARPGVTIASISVLVDGLRYYVSVELSKEVAHEVSVDAIMAPLRRQIMGAIEQKLFNDFNRRDFS